MAFLVLSSIMSQLFVVIFSAVSACSLVVFSKKLDPGRYDWKLLTGTFGLAVTFAGTALGLGVLGPNGAW